MIRVLIADDSAFMRKVLSDLFTKESDFEVVGVAFNGKEAVDKVLKLKPDLLTMDVNMPVMDGLQALAVIMKDCPLPVVMLSSLTKEGADATIRALELGAVDFISKTGGSISQIDTIADKILTRCRSAATANISRLQGPAEPVPKKSVNTHPSGGYSPPPGMRRIEMPRRSGMKLISVVPPTVVMQAMGVQPPPPVQEPPAEPTVKPAEAVQQEKERIPTEAERPKETVASSPVRREKPWKEKARATEKQSSLQRFTPTPSAPPLKPVFVPKPVAPPPRAERPKTPPAVEKKPAAVPAPTPVVRPYAAPAIPHAMHVSGFAAGSGHKLVAIGTSTGGPKALQNVITRLPRNLPCGVVIVQHMPAGFTKSLAERLDTISEISVKEAENQDLIKAGQVYIAPGNFHMQVQAKNGARMIVLNQDPPLASHRPAVDILFDSLVPFARDVVSVILTGMGCDGTAGMKKIKQAGGYIIAEDESTAVVYGMPKSVVDAGIADEVVPVQSVAKAIVEAVKK